MECYPYDLNYFITEKSVAEYTEFDRRTPE